MSNHTPGVWVATGNGVHVRTKCVATTHMPEAEVRYADARLIAAAPELLEALELWQKLGADGCSADEWESCLKSRDAAIAKARGEA